MLVLQRKAGRFRRRAGGDRQEKVQRVHDIQSSVNKVQFRSDYLSWLLLLFFRSSDPIRNYRDPPPVCVGRERLGA